MEDSAQFPHQRRCAGTMMAASRNPMLDVTAHFVRTSRIPGCLDGYALIKSIETHTHPSTAFGGIAGCILRDATGSNSIPDASDCSFLQSMPSAAMLLPCRKRWCRLVEASAGWMFNLLAGFTTRVPDPTLATPSLLLSCHVQASQYFPQPKALARTNITIDTIPRSTAQSERRRTLSSQTDG
ncbi:hypothetical protein N658DRAFT_546575 [Parathielavia hyrcaniae]|uniref:Uncharacterized protein n=1 Tax=Parathielavia hyrcaniae TaxID=113614 RepID=A0AAN6PTW9_9PEZI|nr:hypothetical protein N658DRAFT_546575 [Parathielavia hyrcaniae]